MVDQHPEPAQLGFDIAPLLEHAVEDVRECAAELAETGAEILECESL